MNIGIVQAWNSVVKPEDTVYNLGDLAFKSGLKKDNIAWLVSSLNGRHILIKGNHDEDKKIVNFPIHEYHRELTLNIQGVDFLLKHYPYKHAMTESDKVNRPECFTEDELGVNNNLAPLICGHVHGVWNIQKHCLNVGFDAWDRLLSEDDIIQIYNDTNGFTDNLDKYNKA